MRIASGLAVHRTRQTAVRLCPLFDRQSHVQFRLYLRSFGAIRDGRNDSSDRMVASTLDQGRRSTAGTSTDIIYPVSKLVKGQYQPGRTIEYNFKSSPDRWWHPKSTRLVVHYKAVFGEVDSTCADPIKGPQDSTGARPSKSVSFTPLPNTSLFGTGQARFTANGVVCENSNHLYDQSMVQLLLTQNREACLLYTSPSPRDS